MLGGHEAMKVQAVWESRCVLGEGLVWREADASMYFVDIKGREVLAYTPETGAQRRWSVPQMTGWLVPGATSAGIPLTKSIKWIAGMQQGIALLRLNGSEVEIEWLHRLHDASSDLRLNDAKADAQGRLWFGSMNNRDCSRPEGFFYCWKPGFSPVAVDAGYGVTNGPTFSRDGKTLYHTDSFADTIYAFDVSERGELSNKRVWVKFAAGEGSPDGMCTDAQDHVWVAHWNGSRVTRRDPSGRVVQTIEVDAPHVTNVAFGGAAYADLYITTATVGLDEAGLKAAPTSGALFVAKDVGQGCAPGLFKGQV
jgi:xylono-1,5-lactonase